MISKVTVCNICGKEFDMWDKQEGLMLHKTFGYGSTHDCDQINIDICCKCIDKILDEMILPICKINPITENHD